MVYLTHLWAVLVVCSSKGFILAAVEGLSTALMLLGINNSICFLKLLRLLGTKAGSAGVIYYATCLDHRRTLFRRNLANRKRYISSLIPSGGKEQNM